MPNEFALCHHPLEFLTEFDWEAIRVDLHRNYQGLFNGHVHELNSSYTHDLYGTLFISIANSTIKDEPKTRKNVDGYSIVDLYPSERFEVLYRKYLENHDKFVPNTEVGTDDGRKVFPILRDLKLEKFESNIEIIEHLENTYFEKLNDHLIVNESSTGINCTIDTLFVEPTILNFPNRAAKDESIEYTIESIISSDDSFLLYGPSESGKTILLDKFFIEACRKFNIYQKIPILLKFNDIREKDVLKKIREFREVSSKN
jgi:hypothetical protein